LLSKFSRENTGGRRDEGHSLLWILGHFSHVEGKERTMQERKKKDVARVNDMRVMPNKLH
jgi:hypothetical protein